MTKNTKPEFIEDEHLEFLDELRASGATNMFGARPHIQKAFPELTIHEAAQLLTYWMENFDDGDSDILD